MSAIERSSQPRNPENPGTTGNRNLRNELRSLMDRRPTREGMKEVAKDIAAISVTPIAFMAGAGMGLAEFGYKKVKEKVSGNVSRKKREKIAGDNRQTEQPNRPAEPTKQKHDEPLVVDTTRLNDEDYVQTVFNTLTEKATVTKKDANGSDQEGGNTFISKEDEKRIEEDVAARKRAAELPQHISQFMTEDGWEEGATPIVGVTKDVVGTVTTNGELLLGVIIQQPNGNFVVLNNDVMFAIQPANANMEMSYNAFVNSKIPDRKISIFDDRAGADIDGTMTREATKALKTKLMNMGARITFSNEDPDHKEVVLACARRALEYMDKARETREKEKFEQEMEAIVRQVAESDEHRIEESIINALDKEFVEDQDIESRTLRELAAAQPKTQPKELPITQQTPELPATQEPPEPQAHVTVRDMQMVYIRNQLVARGPEETKTEFDHILQASFKLKKAPVQVEKTDHDQPAGEKGAVNSEQARDHEEYVEFLAVTARVTEDPAEGPAREDMPEYRGMVLKDLFTAFEGGLGEFTGKKAEELRRLESLVVGRAIEIPFAVNKDAQEKVEEGKVKYRKVAYAITEIRDDGPRTFLAIPEGDTFRGLDLVPNYAPENNKDIGGVENAKITENFLSIFSASKVPYVLPDLELSPGESILDAIIKQLPLLWATWKNKYTGSPGERQFEEKVIAALSQSPAALETLIKQEYSQDVGSPGQNPASNQ